MPGSIISTGMDLRTPSFPVTSTVPDLLCVYIKQNDILETALRHTAPNRDMFMAIGLDTFVYKHKTKHLYNYT